MAEQQQEQQEFQERVVTINRCVKVVKGGRRFSFRALVVVGNGNGRIGIGKGKAKDISEAVRKGSENARKTLVTIDIKDGALSHEVIGTFGAVKVFLSPASKGTGVIAGGSARAVLELAGVTNVLSKVYDSTNPFNVVRATLNALKKQKSKEFFQNLRGTVE